MSFDLTVTITDWSSWIHRLHTSTADAVVRASLVEMAEALRDSEDMWAASSAGQGAEAAAVEERILSPIVQAQKDYQEEIAAAQQAAASSAGWGDFGQQQQQQVQAIPVQQQQQHQARSHRSASTRTSFPPPPSVPSDFNPLSTSSALPTSNAASAYGSSTLPTNFHAYQQHQAARASGLVPYPSAASARYNGNQAGVCTGGLLPSVQQGFGQMGMPVGRCW
jgi:hypothetical protein